MDELAEMVARAKEDIEICPKCKAAIIRKNDGEVFCNCKPDGEDVVEKEEKPEEGKPAAPEMPIMSVKDLLKDIEGAPDENQIASWKQQFGAVYSLPFDVKEVYLFRYINRKEWQGLIANESLMQDENLFQETIVQHALLWPTLGPVAVAGSRGGLIPTLFQAITNVSYFLEPALAVQLIQEV